MIQIKHPALLFLALSIGLLMVGIDFLAIGVAIGPMTKDLSIDIATLQWFLTAFSIGNCSFQIASGKCADLYGHKKVYILAFLLFTLSSLSIALTSSPHLITVARLVQGASGGVFPTVSFAIIMLAFAPSERTKWIGRLIGVGGLGLALGPLVGGFLIHHFSWRAIFLINLPIGCIGIIAAFFLIPKMPRHPHHDEKIDWIGMILLIATLVLFTTAINQGHAWSWSSIKTLACIASTLILAIIFFFSEIKSTHPLIDRSLLKAQNFLVASLSGSFFYFSITAWVLLFGIYLQRVMGMTPLQTGISFLPFGAAVALVSLIIKPLIARLGGKSIMVAGSVFTFLAFTGLAMLPPLPSLLLLSLLFALYGLGFICFTSSSVPIALEFVEKHKMGLGSAKVNMLRWLGGALGSAIMATVFISRYTSTHSYHAALVECMMVIAFLAALVTLTVIWGIKKA